MVLLIKRKGGSRYVGEVVYDDPVNGRKFMADMNFYQGRGYDLTGWALAGTVPTIDANGDIDFYATNVNISRATISIPNTLGKYDFIYGVRFTRQADDVLSWWSPMSGLILGSGDSGIAGQFRTADAGGRWFNTGPNGTALYLAFAQVIGTEYTLVMVKTQSDIYFYVNDVLMINIKVSNKGTAPSSLTPEQAWHSLNKNIMFDTESPGAAQPTHKKVREIVVGRLVGVSQ